MRVVFYVLLMAFLTLVSVCFGLGEVVSAEPPPPPPPYVLYLPLVVTPVDALNCEELYPLCWNWDLVISKENCACWFLKMV